jgi:hypothetical protein
MMMSFFYFMWNYASLSEEVEINYISRILKGQNSRKEENKFSIEIMEMVVDAAIGSH